MLWSAAVKLLGSHLVCVALLAASAFAAPTNVGVMPVEAPDVEAAGRRIHAALLEAVRSMPELAEKGPIGMRLDEARMTFSCFEETPECMQQVGGLLEVEELIWGHVSRSDTGWALKLRRLSVPDARIVRSEDVLVVDAPGAQAELERVAGAFVKGLPLTVRPVAQLTIISAPAGATVLLDGREVGEAPVTVPAAHGPHSVEVLGAGGRVARRNLSVDGDRTLELSLVASADEGRSTGFWLGVGTGALAVAAAGVSTYYGIETLRLQQKVEDDLTQSTHDDVQPDFDRAKLVANVGWGFAGVSAALSAYFFLLHDDVTASLAAHGDGGTVSVSGRF